jgi:dTDP-4-dehydrorhamnose 3,5-epimerase
MPAAVEPSSRIDGVFVVRFQKFGDGRGYFYETFRRTWIPGVPDMIQGNCSFSRAGVLRGMHYHLKQADFWSVPAGRVRAALYDFRPTSPTRGAAQMLEMGGEENRVGLYIPRGVAHGFCAIEDAVMTYLVDEYYDGADELGIRWDDPAMGLDWALELPAVLSDRDAANPMLAAIPPHLRPR